MVNKKGMRNAGHQSWFNENRCTVMNLYKKEMTKNNDGNNFIRINVRCLIHSSMSKN